MKVVQNRPDTWRALPLWAMFTRKKDVGHPDEQMLSIFREHGVVPKDRYANLNVTAENRDIYQLIDDGWLAVNRMKAWQGAVGVSMHRGIVSGHYICFAPTTVQRNARYVNWLLRSTPYTAAYRALSRGVRPGQEEIDNDQLRSIEIILPPLEDQRRIADFLDAQIALLDRAIALRHEQTYLLAERDRVELGSIVERLVEIFGDIPLRRLTLRIEQGTSPDCYAYPASPGDYGVLKVSGVRDGRFRREENKALPQAIEPDVRYLVAPGDVLVTRGSGSRALVGTAAVVDEVGDARLLLPDLLYRLVLKDEVDPAFVVGCLLSPRLRSEIGLATRGAVGGTIKLRGGDILDLRIPSADHRSQAEFSRVFRRARTEANSRSALLGQSMALLQERKQALITAAVTGEFDVTTARSVA